MIRAIIIDDEQHCINRIDRLLRIYCRQSVDVVGSCQTIDAGIEAIQNLQPDLIFLDIQIHDKTGFDLLQQLDQVHFEVIFTTAYEQYAIQAFKFSALDYLLKPIDPDDLTQAIERLNKRMSKDIMPQKLETLLHNLKDFQGVSKRIAIPTISGLTFVSVNEIIRCESSINYTTIFLKDKQKITVAKTLKEFEELLTDYHFFRIHNSHLINIACIERYQKGKGGSVLMTDHSEIQVSTRRKEAFLKKMSHWQ